MPSPGRFTTRLGRRLPGRTRPGSQASFRRGYTLSARQSMADIIAKYERLIRRLEKATPTILMNAIQPVRNKAAIYVPKKTGALASSEQVIVGTDDNGKPMVSLVYGDETAWYAALVHEMTWLNHVYPTRAKYLQAALEEELDSFLVSVAVDYAALL